MIEKEQNFFEFVYDVFYKFAQINPENIGFVISRKIQYPTIDFFDQTQIVIPLPRKQNDELVFEGMIFENTEEGRKSMWCLFLATIYHMAAHASVSEYSSYEDWRKNKTIEICHKVIDFIEDVNVEKYIAHTNSEILENIKNVDSRLLLLEESQNKVKNSDKSNHIRSFSLTSDEKTADTIKMKIIKENKDGNNRILSFADFIYKNRELLPKTSLPYREHHDYYPIIKTEKRGILLEPLGEEFTNNVTKLDELWSINEREKTKIFRKYKKHLKNLNFDKIIIPQGDLQKFLQIKITILPMLRKIRQQIRMITNLNDDPRIDQIGYVDMQMAIQSLASEGQSTDIFERDEPRRGEEAWVILVDKSSSMHLRFDKIKEFTICMAESANELAGKSDAWALYGFDNNFQILKDFSEKYNTEVQARIGNMECSGLSLLPDAIDLASRILTSDPRERKYLFVITDGYPSGYERIQTLFSKVVKRVEVSDITLIAIGVSKGVTKSFRVSAKGNDLKQLVTKFITAYRNASSQDV